MPRSDREKPVRPSEVHDEAYVPTAPGDWNDPDPRSAGEALDDLAAGGVGGGGSYTPAVPDDWEDADPTTVVGGLDRIAGGHAGVCLVSGTEPTDPAIGQWWLDTSAPGTGGFGTLNYITITGDLVLTSSHTVVYCDATAGPIIVTVPTASANGGRLYAIVKIDSTNNTVTMDEGFDAVLTVQDEAVPISSDGSDWRIPW